MSANYIIVWSNGEMVIHSYLEVTSTSHKVTYTGCPVKLFPLQPLGYLLFCRLLLMQIAKVQEICYVMSTGILKINLEIAEIIDVKVGNHHLEINILLLHRGRKIISMLKVATFTSIISAFSNSIFKIVVPIVKQIS